MVAYEAKQRKLSSKSPNKERGLRLIAGTGDNSVEDVIELSNYAANIGYQYALIKPPFYYKVSESTIIHKGINFVHHLFIYLFIFFS